MPVAPRGTASLASAGLARKLLLEWMAVAPPLRSIAQIAKTNGVNMNWDQIEGKWKQLRGTIRAKWGKITDDDFDMLSGQKDRLVGKIQEYYGIAKEEALQQIDEWRTALKESDHETPSSPLAPVSPRPDHRAADAPQVDTELAPRDSPLNPITARSSTSRP